MSNVIVESNRYTVESLYQWDLNQVLTIYGLSLTSIPEIHFTNTSMDRAIVKQAAMDDAGVISVDVPNSLLQKPYKITAYVCICEGDTFKSLYAIEIPVKARKKPGDYTLENDEEVYSFNALENKIDNAVLICEETVSAVNTKCDNTVSTLTATLNNSLAKTEANFTNEIAELESRSDKLSAASNKNHYFENFSVSNYLKSKSIYVSMQGWLYNPEKCIKTCYDMGVRHNHIYIAFNKNGTGDDLGTVDDIELTRTCYAIAREYGFIQDVIKFHVGDRTIFDDENLRGIYKSKVNEYIQEFNADNNLNTVYILNENEYVTLNQDFEEWIIELIDLIHSHGLKAGIPFQGERNASKFRVINPTAYEKLDVIGVNIYPAISYDGKHATIEQSIDSWKNRLRLVEDMKIKDNKVIEISETGCIPYWDALKLPYTWKVSNLPDQTKGYEAVVIYFYGLFENGRILSLVDNICLWFAEYFPENEVLQNYFKFLEGGGIDDY